MKTLRVFLLIVVAVAVLGLAKPSEASYTIRNAVQRRAVNFGQFQPGCSLVEMSFYYGAYDAATGTNSEKRLEEKALLTIAQAMPPSLSPKETTEFLADKMFLLGSLYKSAYDRETNYPSMSVNEVVNSLLNVSNVCSPT